MPELANNTYQPRVHQPVLNSREPTTNNKARFSYPDTTKVYPGGYAPVSTNARNPERKSHVIPTTNRKQSAPAYFIHDGYDVCPQSGVVRLPSQSSQTPGDADIPQTYMGLALVVTLCFNCPIGLLALLIAYCSRKAWLSGNKKTAAFQAKASLVVSMMGILATIAIVISVVWYAVGQKKKENG